MFKLLDVVLIKNTKTNQGTTPKLCIWQGLGGSGEGMLDACNLTSVLYCIIRVSAAFVAVSILCCPVSFFFFLIKAWATHWAPYLRGIPVGQQAQGKGKQESCTGPSPDHPLHSTTKHGKWSPPPPARIEPGWGGCPWCSSANQATVPLAVLCYVGLIVMGLSLTHCELLAYSTWFIWCHILYSCLTALHLWHPTKHAEIDTFMAEELDGTVNEWGWCKRTLQILLGTKSWCCPFLPSMSKMMVHMLTKS